MLLSSVCTSGKNESAQCVSQLFSELRHRDGPLLSYLTTSMRVNRLLAEQDSTVVDFVLIVLFR